MSAVPSGLAGLFVAKPNVETLGYYHASLRDEHEILVALGFQTRRAPEAGNNLPTWKSAIQQAWKPALPVRRRSRLESQDRPFVKFPRNRGDQESGKRARAVA